MTDMDINTEMKVNSTEAMSCPASGQERWWIFLVNSILIYIIGLSLSLIAFTLHWLVVTRFKLINITATDSKRRSFQKIFQNRARLLLLGDTILSRIVISTSLLCNIAYIVLGIYRSYSVRTVEKCFTLSESPAIILELVVVILLIIFSIIRFLASDNVVLYWFDIYTIVDVFTLPHIFVSIAFGVDWIGLRSLRFVWLAQITTVLRFTPFIHSQDAIDITSLFISFLVLWLTSSGIIHLVEKQGDPWRGFDNRVDNPVLVYAYFIMVTMSTVGYGDISPKTDLGRTFMTFFIIGGLAFFAAILPKLIEVISNYYAKIQYARFNTTLVPRHVIVCGHITAVTAEDFLKDFLHPDRTDSQIHVLFLHPERPGSELKNIIRSYYSRVQYLLGSVMNSKDLKTAKILTSKAVFILANKHAENPTKEDHANLLRVVSVKNTKGTIPVIVQLLHSFSKKQVKGMEGWKRGRDIAVCLNELKLGLLAQSCLCPGFSTLIANLFYTSGITSFTGEHAWKRDYLTSISNELYCSSFSNYFDGMKFHEVAYVCYNNLHNLVLLAIEQIEHNRQEYYVNPSPNNNPELKIDSNVTLGYFIAQDKAHVSLVSAYCNCCPDNRHKTAVVIKNERSIIQKQDGNRSPEERSETVKCIVLDPIDEAEHAITMDLNHAECSRVRFCSTEQDSEISNISAESGRKLSCACTTDSSDEEIESYEGIKFHEYVFESNKLKASILNPNKTKVEDSILRPKETMRDHIVLCIFADDNSPLLGLHNFLKPLRREHLPPDSIKPVVIISEKAFIEKEWSIIRSISNIYLVVGSPLRWANLKAANVTECSVCVVLSALATSSGHELAMEDKEAILCSLSIQKKLKAAKREVQIQIITDLRQESNVQFLDLGDEDEPNEGFYKAQPFACGEAFSDSIFNSITTSAFYGPGSLYLVEDLIHASGTNTACQVFLLWISITGFSGKTFKQFYNAELKKFNICLGISRKLSSRDGERSFRRYVITSPDPETILHEDDIVFMLTE